jgi:predicted Rossmann fold nucleotide-binding protein DprA/Smf involved in DNA uptake
VVVEAPEKSGALITAGFARDEGRDLWMDVTGLNSKKGGGMAQFIEDGAMRLSSVCDILAEWNAETPSGCPSETHTGCSGGVKDGQKSCNKTQNDGADLAASFAKEFDIKL